MKSTIGNVLVYLSSTTLFKLHFYSLVAFKSEYNLFLLYFYSYQHWENNFGNLRISRPPKGLSRLKAYSVGQGYSYKKTAMFSDLKRSESKEIMSQDPCVILRVKCE